MPVTNIDKTALKLYRLQDSRPDAIEFSANNPKGVSIDRTNPIMAIDCTLTGTLTAGTAAATIADGGALALINRLTLRVGGDKDVFRVPGKLLPVLDTLYRGKEPAKTEVVGTVGDNAFRHAFRLPINAATAERGLAGYVSQLDASGATSLTLEATWRDVNGIATAGGGGTIALSGAEKLQPRVVHSYQPQVGLPGAIGYKDAMLHLCTADVFPVNASNERMKINLDQGRVHNRVILMTEQDNVRVNTILNSLTVGVGEANFRLFDGDEIRDNNYADYNLANPWTGVYVVDFTLKGFWEQMLNFDGTQELEVRCNVTKPGTGTSHNLTVLYDRFVLP